MGRRMGCGKAPAEWHGFLPCDENAQRLGKIDIKIFFQDESCICIIIMIMIFLFHLDLRMHT